MIVTNKKHPIIFENINEENLFHNLWRTNMYHHSMYSILLIISQYIIVLVKYLLFSYFFVVSESVIVRNSLCPLCCAWILGSVVNQYSIHRSWWWNNRCWLYCRVLIFAIKVLPDFTHNSREKNWCTICGRNESWQEQTLTIPAISKGLK